MRSGLVKPAISFTHSFNLAWVTGYSLDAATCAAVAGRFIRLPLKRKAKPHHRRFAVTKLYTKTPGTTCQPERLRLTQVKFQSVKLLRRSECYAMQIPRQYQRELALAWNLLFFPSLV